MKKVKTLEEASKITGREITTRPGSWPAILWFTDTHEMSIRAPRLDGICLLVVGEPRPSGKCGRGRSRVIWVPNPSERYLKTLQPKL